MDPQYTLVRIYLFVCQHYQHHLRAAAQRQTGNSDPDFTDEEVLTIYLFGIIEKRRTISEIYDYARDHFPDWFPDLPSYGGYNHLWWLQPASEPVERSFCSARRRGAQGGEALKEVSREDVVETVRIADSMPIMMAKEKRSSQASVASEFANKGYCSSKGVFFYGVKLHVVGQRKRSAMPVLECAGLTPGSENDLTALRRVLPTLEGGQLYGDKAYCDKAYCDGAMKERLAEEQNLVVLTPVKKKKGQTSLSAADKLFSEAVSKVRQPIESLLGWINEKTGIQRASKVRSYRGLLVHVFGRLAAAMLLLAFNS